MEFIMFKSIMTVSLLAAAIASTSAVAADNSAGGIINFTGAITDTTCTINGGKSADFTVALSPISVKDAGTTVGLITKNKKSIALTFSGCSPAAGTTGTPLKVNFSSADNISTDGKYLLNNSVNESDASVARNVGFALVEPGSSTPITLNQPYTTNIMGTATAPDSRSEEKYSCPQSSEISSRRILRASGSGVP